MKVILDRFEGYSAIVELPNQKHVTVPAVLFEGAKEGDVVTILVDSSETQKRREKITELMKDMMVDE